MRPESRHQVIGTKGLWASSLQHPWPRRADQAIDPALPGIPVRPHLHPQDIEGQRLRADAGRAGRESAGAMGTQDDQPRAELQRQADGAGPAGTDLHPQGGGGVERGEHGAQSLPGGLGQGLVHGPGGQEGDMVGLETRSVFPEVGHGQGRIQPSGQGEGLSQHSLTPGIGIEEAKDGTVCHRWPPLGESDVSVVPDRRTGLDVHLGTGGRGNPDRTRGLTTFQKDPQPATTADLGIEPVEHGGDRLALGAKQIVRTQHTIGEE